MNADEVLVQYRQRWTTAQLKHDLANIYLKIENLAEQYKEDAGRSYDTDVATCLKNLLPTKETAMDVLLRLENEIEKNDPEINVFDTISLLKRLITSSDD